MFEVSEVPQQQCDCVNRKPAVDHSQVHFTGLSSDQCEESADYGLDLGLFSSTGRYFLNNINGFWYRVRVGGRCGGGEKRGRLGFWFSLGKASETVLSQSPTNLPSEIAYICI